MKKMAVVLERQRSSAARCAWLRVCRRLSGRSPFALMLVSFLTVLTPSLLVIQLTRASVPQHFPTHLCQRQANQPAIEVVLAVKTSPANFAERQAIRHSMASPPALAVLPWRVVFYMGYARDMAKSRFLRWEVSNKGDLIIAPHEDHAQNTVKVLMHTIRWVHERCEPELRYFVHTNDSTMVDLVAAHEFLRNVTEGARCFYCAPVSNVPVDRNVSSPTYVSKTLFPDQYFPTFCEGDAIIVPAKKLRPLVLASEAIAQFPLLGPYITGHLPVLAGIVHNDLSAKIYDLGQPPRLNCRAPERPIFLTNVNVIAQWKLLWLESLICYRNQTDYAAQTSERIVENIKINLLT